MCSNVEMILNSHNPCETFESVSEPAVPSGPTRAGGIARRGRSDPRRGHRAEGTLLNSHGSPATPSPRAVDHTDNGF